MSHSTEPQSQSATSASPRSTPLIDQHRALDAKIVDFGGWALPVNYGSQIEEHKAVRTTCGMFDVSHMTVSDINGPDTLAFLRKVLANDIDKAVGNAGKAIYSCMLNEQGGVIDDLIVYFLNEANCRLVTNAGTNEKDMAWLKKQSEVFDVQFEEKPELALLAVQGPDAIETCKVSLDPDLANFCDSLSRFQGGYSDDIFVGRTGYTGEDGYEFIASAAHINKLWLQLLDAGVVPCGLGARDTLRLESGMSLYGNDLDEHHSPLESGLKWSVSITEGRDFIGKSALSRPTSNNMIGLILLDKGVLRGHQKVLVDDQEIGQITSGTFSPTLQQSIALARVSQSLKIGDKVQIAVRAKKLDAVVARSPFVKNGSATN